jgi:alpha-galactosidase
VKRREFIRLSTGALAASWWPPSLGAYADTFQEKLRVTPGRIIPAVAGDDTERVELRRSWDVNFCKLKVINHGNRGVRIKEVMVCEARHDLPDDTGLYGESFQMLSQTGGTLGHPLDLGYSELKHYRIPQPPDALALSGMMTLALPANRVLLLGFSSCHRFMGRFFLYPGVIQGVVDTEGLELAPGEIWDLEELMVAEGNQRFDLLSDFARRAARNHRKRNFQPAPTGWCSWYCFGAKVTADQVLQNLELISRQLPQLKYVQIDDGYQAAMGDWLETGKAFGGDVVKVLQEIRRRGFEPAIWVAPFVAEPNSRIFRQHPDWFIRGADEKPLVSSDVTFGGWRHGPWYALDGTHPQVQQHFENVFTTMRRDWGCTYFKLDANFWGAMHGGRFHDPKATRIQAYRRGMEAIRRGAGNSFILGCNHPLWPSFGLIDGSRSSGDIKRTWNNFRSDARQTLNRNWQNGRLWWNDPDAVLLTGDLTDDEFQFHATAIYASGGMVLSGDDLTKISPARMAMLKGLIPPTGVAAEFKSDSMDAGFIRLADKLMVCLFNWNDTPQSLSFELPAAAHISDYWSAEDLGRHQGTFAIRNMPPHSARLLICRPEPVSGNAQGSCF